MTMRPIGSIGWRTVVSGGSVQFMSAESSNPTTETSSGTLSPARRAALIAPSAIGSLAQTMPVIPRASSRIGRGLRRLERVQRVGDVVGAELEPASAAMRSRARSILRRDGTWSRGPTSSPIRVWPSEIRWPIACSTATASSHETRGNAEPVDAGVDEDRRQAALGQPAIVPVRRVGLGVQAAGEDDARDLLLQQQVDVVGLGHATDRLGAQDRA